MKPQDQNPSIRRRRGRLALLVAGASATLALTACLPLKSPPPAPPESPPTTAPPTTAPPVLTAELECAGPGSFSDVRSVGTAQSTDECVLENTGDGPSGALTATLTNPSGVTASWSIVTAATNDCDGVSLAPGDVCNIAVQFQSAGNVGVAQNTLHVVGANGATLDQPLEGTVGPDFEFTAPATVTTTVGNTTQFTVDVENLGSAQTGTLSYGTVVDNPAHGSIAVPGGNCGDQGPGSTCFFQFDWTGSQVGSTFVTLTLTPNTGVPTSIVIPLHVT